MRVRVRFQSASCFVSDSRFEHVSIKALAARMPAVLSGYRSRIFVAYSTDGLTWERSACVIDGLGYGGEGLDAVHAEDMSLMQIGSGKYRMYYAACDKEGHWRIANAVTDESTSEFR